MDLHMDLRDVKRKIQKFATKMRGAVGNIKILRLFESIITAKYTHLTWITVLAIYLATNVFSFGLSFSIITVGVIILLGWIYLGTQPDYIEWGKWWFSFIIILWFAFVNISPILNEAYENADKYEEIIPTENVQVYFSDTNKVVIVMVEELDQPLMYTFSEESTYRDAKHTFRNGGFLATKKKVKQWTDEYPTIGYYFGKWKLK